jgi:hypothetical protein
LRGLIDASALRFLSREAIQNGIRRLRKNTGTTRVFYDLQFRTRERALNEEQAVV